MTCAKCNNQIDEAGNFCSKCGEEIFDQKMSLKNFRLFVLVVNFFLMFSIVKVFGLNPENFGYGLGYLLVFNAILYIVRKVIISYKIRYHLKLLILPILAILGTLAVDTITTKHPAMFFVFFVFIFYYFLYKFLKK